MSFGCGASKLIRQDTRQRFAVWFDSRQVRKLVPLIFLLFIFKEVDCSRSSFHFSIFLETLSIAFKNNLAVYTYIEIFVSNNYVNFL